MPEKTWGANQNCSHCMRPDCAAERALVSQSRGTGLDIHEWMRLPKLEITRHGVFEGLSAEDRLWFSLHHRIRWAKSGGTQAAVLTDNVQQSSLEVETALPIFIL